MAKWTEVEIEMYGSVTVTIADYEEDIKSHFDVESVDEVDESDLIDYFTELANDGDIEIETDAAAKLRKSP